jgi:Arc/MetJ-type ribon-helix-helix transcriptional regulator
MPASIRLSPELQEMLRNHAERNKLSASDVVREALAQYFATRTATPHELGEPLFGRHRSSPDTSDRSRERKAIVRARVRRKHARP